MKFLFEPDMDNKAEKDFRLIPVRRLRGTVISITVALSLMLLVASLAKAQTAEELNAKIPPNLPPDVVEIHKIISKGYVAYSKKDAATILTLFSKKSPYFPSFKQSIEEDFAVNEKVKIDGLRALLTHDVELQGDKATARLDVQIHGVNSDTGQEADGFGPQDHTLHFVKEDDGWKIWQFISTAEELTQELIGADTEEQRVALLNKREPFTNGLIRGIADEAASLLERKGDDVNAEMLFKLLFNLSGKIDSLLGKANALVGLGDVYLSRGEYLRAASNFQQVMAIAEKVGSKEGVAAVSIKLGNVHYHQGDFDQAMEYYQRSADLYEKLGSTQQIAYPLLSIGNAYFKQHDLTRALEYYQKSLRVYDSIFDRAGSAYLLNRIGEVYADQERTVQAIESYRQSLGLQDKYGFKSMKAQSLLGLGAVSEKSANYAEAARQYSSATQIAREQNSPEILWRALTAQGRTFLALNDSVKAEHAFTEAITILERMRGQLAGDEREQQLFFEDKTEPYVALVELATQRKDFSEALRYAELAKARKLLDVVRNGRGDLNAMMTDEERQQNKELKANLDFLNSQLRKQGTRPKPDPIRIAAIEAELRAARLAAEAYETRIYAAHPKALMGPASRTTTWSPSLIDNETALLEYVVAPQKTYVFVLTKSPESPVELNMYSIKIDAAELSRRVKAFRLQMEENSLAFREPSRQLYDLLLKPAQRQLEGKKRLCIIPAGDLWELPFQALLSGSERYLLEQFAISFAPSLSVLAEIRTRSAAGRPTNELSFSNVSDKQVLPPIVWQQSILALGNPKFDREAFSKSRGTSFGDLPAAEREVKSLAGIYGVDRSKVLTGTAAQEEVFKSSAPQYSVLHLATHGIFDDANPMYSRLLLAGPTAGEDGFLEAREVMKLNLPADLVVLSACQTARGQVSNGEGLIGMSWAFLIAGTSTTVVSQWKVDSESTTQLMVNFHRNLQRENLNQSEALKQAAQTLMKDPKYRHPFYWSGFVMIGGSR
ncbi:MAG TPA: CHAT domain-containing protein [Pyrinomonadaceae bacterium]|nr:CHAT domain-containing protein [Pyrinomonadaceae bacterium]